MTPNDILEVLNAVAGQMHYFNCPKEEEDIIMKQIEESVAKFDNEAKALYIAISKCCVTALLLA